MKSADERVIRQPDLEETTRDFAGLPTRYPAVTALGIAIVCSYFHSRRSVIPWILHFIL